MLSSLIFQCRKCGEKRAEWIGQCPKCKDYNSYAEKSGMTKALHLAKVGSNSVGYAGQRQEVTKLKGVTRTQKSRATTGLKEFDLVLGGGLVVGSVVLVCGDPGVGKSTLLLQTATYLAENQSVLYVTGEESLSQVASRAERLSLPMEKLNVVAETNVERICENLIERNISVAILDSIQTLQTDSVTSASGGISQIKESAGILTRFAKSKEITLIIVGHVTKDGELAGPRVLEHIVDCVLYFKGESNQNYRMIRAVKNRFGAINELGVFEMTAQGLKEVSDPSAIFLSKHNSAQIGSAIMVSREENRPFLVEVQALVNESEERGRQVVLGLEHNRLAMLLAVMQQHAEIDIVSANIYINVIGGLKISETGSDLAVLLACVSSLDRKPLPSHLAVFGEVSLTGEIRAVSNAQERMQEAYKNGFKVVIIPEANTPKQPIEGLTVIPVASLSQALEFAFEISEFAEV